MDRILEKVVNGGTTDYRHYIFEASEEVAVYSRTSADTNTLHFILRDHQGSIVSLTNGAGPPANAVVESFTAFGNRRSGTTWSGAPTSGDETTINGITREGYTGQTVLGVSMGLNHMNGRVQDSITGRFLSPDPYIPDPGNTQSYNRYSYVNNNPVTLIDPTGFDNNDSGQGDVKPVDPPDGLDEIVVTAQKIGFGQTSVSFGGGDAPPLTTIGGDPVELGVIGKKGGKSSSSSNQVQVPQAQGGREPCKTHCPSLDDGQGASMRFLPGQAEPLL